MAHSHGTPSSGLLWHTVTAHYHRDYYGTQSQHTVIRIIMEHSHSTPSSGLLWHTVTAHSHRIIMAHNHGTPSSGLLCRTVTAHHHLDYFGTHSQHTVRYYGTE